MQQLIPYKGGIYEVSIDMDDLSSESHMIERDSQLSSRLSTKWFSGYGMTLNSN